MKMEMSATTIAGIIVLGLITGFLAGMLGIGGGLIVIPSLIILFGFTQQSAQGTSLAMMLPPVGIFAVMTYYKAGHVDLKVALILAAMFIVGSIFGSKLAVKIPQDILKKIFGVFLLLVAIKMLFWK
jgi:uncharacterized membrane protein YfcA